MANAISMEPGHNAVGDEEQGEEQGSSPELTVGSLPLSPNDEHHALQRGLSARQVSMIAIAGTIGTGLFLGTGRSLAQGGPASMLICYAIVGFIVYITLLLLGEMATQYPVAGEFTCDRSSHWVVKGNQGPSTHIRPDSSPLRMPLRCHGTTSSTTQFLLPRT